MSELKRPITCDEFDALLDLGDPRSWSGDARGHVATCPRCAALAQALSEVPEAELPPATLASATNAAVRDLTPVGSLSGPLAAAAGTVAALVLLALVSVWVFGTHGWAARLPWQRAASYLGAGTVLALTLAAAVREREPGLSLAAPWRYVVAGIVPLLWAWPFALYDFRPETRFWQHGSLCCCIGLLVGTAAGAVIWIVMRRGYMLSPLRAGWFSGVAAGCVGFIVQETYCPVVESGHAALWHGGVVALLGTGGWIAGWRVLRTGR